MRFCLATIASRRKILPDVINSLRAQTAPCEIQVYYNDYTPDDTDGVDFPLLAPYGDLGDRGKFVSPHPEWNLFVDDDIIYPKNYAERMIGESIEKGMPVCVHGAVLPRSPKNYFQQRQVFHFSSKAVGRKVNVAGTGTLCLKSPGFDHKLFDQPNMADVYYAVRCQQTQTPIWMIGRVNGWLREIPTETSLWKSRGDGEAQSSLVRSHRWRIF